MDIDARFDRIEEKIDKLSEKILTVELVQKLEKEYHKSRRSTFYQLVMIAFSLVLSGVAIYKVV